MRACACTCTRAGAAIFVQIGAGNFSEMCVLFRCGRARARPHIHFSFLAYFFFNLKYAGPGARAYAKTVQNVCDVRAGEDENPRTLTVWIL